MTLDNLSSIKPTENWTVANHQIVRVEKRKGKLKNLINFNTVMKVARDEIQGKSLQDISSCMANLTKRYNDIKSAISKQNPITKLFLRVVLYYCRFDRNYKELLEAQSKTPIEIQSTINAIKTKPEIVQLPIVKQALPPIRGGFQNAGNTCPIAAGLQLLNAMADILPSDIEKELVKKDETEEEFSKRKTHHFEYARKDYEREGKTPQEIIQELSKLEESFRNGDLQKKVEPQADFEKRKEIAKLIVKMLEQSNKQKTASIEDMDELQKLLGYTSASGKDQREVLNKILKVLGLEPNLTFLYPIRTSFKQVTRNFPIGTPSQTSSGQYYLNFLKDPNPLADGSYTSIYHDLKDNKSQLPPLYFPLGVGRDKLNDRKPVTIPQTFICPSTSGYSGKKYELIACASSSGSLESGHNYAFVKGDGKWIKYDDSLVVQVTNQEAIQDMEVGCDYLIYRRINP
jgi:hypothetical protein